MKGWLRATSDGTVRCRERCQWPGKVTPNRAGAAFIFESGDFVDVKAGELVPHHFDGWLGLVLEPTEE